MNKNFLKFTSITLFLTVSMFVIIYKLIPVLFLHTVYYCQQLINSFSIQIPQQINLILISFIMITIFVFVTRLFVVFAKIQKMKKNLARNQKMTESMLGLTKKVGLKNKVSFVKDSKPFAFCLGIRNPHIYISTKTVSMMTRRQLEAILLHEKYHLEHADSLTLFIGSLPQLLFPFFPLLPRLLEHYKIEREIKADRKAVRELGTKKPIIAVLKKLLETPSATPAFISSIAETDTLELRIKSLLNKETDCPKIRRLDFLISAFSLGFIVLAIAAPPVHALEMHINNQDTTMVCLGGEECARWCRDHNTVNPPPNMSHLYTPAR